LAWKFAGEWHQLKHLTKRESWWHSWHRDSHDGSQTCKHEGVHLASHQMHHYGGGLWFVMTKH
jgi:hypothetical protein